MIVLVPAYEPDRKLVELVRSIRTTRAQQQIVVVDDGSGPAHAAIFDTCAELGCEVVHHDVNRGKGAALKTGFSHIATAHPGHDVVCADCDGQHTITDVMRVADAVGDRCAGGEGIVLGARRFVGDVPARSRLGNDVTRAVFRLATGVHLQDTQTGLRGYPAAMLPWLQTIPGDRFEYELEALLAAHHDGHRFHEVPIETIYLADNASSHFRPLHDSVRVYLPFLRRLRLARFGLSSLAAFVIDAVLFFVLMALTSQLLVSVVVARVISASTNFAVNRRFVFDQRDPRGRASSARRYASLAAALLVADYLLLAALTDAIGMPLAVAKLVTEVTLFVASYVVQRRHVFAGRDLGSAVVEVQRTTPMPADTMPVGTGGSFGSGGVRPSERG